jgi:hypothetical protein
MSGSVSDGAAEKLRGLSDRNMQRNVAAFIEERQAGMYEYSALFSQFY